MIILNLVMLTLPVVFLVESVVVAGKAYEKGHNMSCRHGSGAGGS